MAKGKNGPGSGSDASYIEPKFVPDDKLLPRDDSGGRGGGEFQKTTQWDGGGKIVGESKGHLDV